MSASERPESPLGAELATALVASAEDAIIATALDGTITSWNAAATRLYGYDAADVVGRPLVGLAPPDAVDDVHETIAQIAAGVRLEPFDTVRRHRSGRALDVSTTASAIHASDGTLVAVSWVERDVTGRRHVEQMVSHLAFHDPLTGLANRALLLDRLQQSLERTRRAGGVVAVLYLDLDEFKQINDRLGHAAGDRVLQLVATRLQSSLRPEDTLARLGGDEFVVVSDRVPSVETALRIADRLATALAPPFAVHEGHMAVSASIGVAVGDADSDSDRVLANADRAMYAAKGRGGGTIASSATATHP